jgi:DNA-binding response OmpR family regulator
MASPNVMVVSGSLETQQAFASILGQWGMAPIIASTTREAETILSRHSISLIFCSDELQGDGVDGLLRYCAQLPCQVPIIVVSRLDDCRHYLNFLQAGAFDYVLYPPNGDEIERVVRNALKSVHFTEVEQTVSAA